MFRPEKPTKEAYDAVKFGKVPSPVLQHPLRFKFPTTFLLLHSAYQLNPHSVFANNDELAAELGVGARTFEPHYQRWVKLGLVVKERGLLKLWPFNEQPDELVVPEQVTEQVTEQVEERLKAKPMPKTTVRLPKGEREARIMAAWNDNLPKGWKEMKEVPLPLKCAIDYHMKNCGVKSGEYDQFIPIVLRKSDTLSPRKTGEFDAVWVFGWEKGSNGNTSLGEWQVDRVKTMYTEGLKVKISRGIDSVAWGDDREVLGLLPDQTYRGVKFERVDRVRVEDDSQETMLFAALNYLQFGQYTVEQAKIKVAQADVTWRDIWAEPGTLVLIYPQTGKIPLSWNLHETPWQLLNN